ncbi:ATP-binding protein [Streptomyces sp. NPDC002055]|uniref:ATP-binding protein n=1 Tax=Streptomyces sp. NPDC002055 TaxID=3154534 RepID=UPI00332D9DF3
MKIGKSIGRFLGLGTERALPPPRYEAVADGLIITDTAAEAWFVLSGSNTDLMAEGTRDAEQDVIASVLARTLAGFDCHLKVLWSPLNAEEYLQETEQLFSAGQYRSWAQLRVDRLDMLDLPSRHLLLGVRMAERNNQTKAKSRAGFQEALGLGTRQVSYKELARFDALTRRLGRQLESTPWRAQPATVEMLAWMIAREQHRSAVLPAANGDGAVTGAKLAQLTQGRVLPYPDHLRIVDPRGQVTAWVSVLAMTGFPEEMETPGSGEWLRAVSEITYIPEQDDLDGGGQIPVVPVNPEVSVRFEVMHKRDALKAIDEARRLAKEQRQSAAKHSAGEAGREIEETEQVMADLSRDMKRDDVTLIEDHPRIVVTSEAGLDDLRAKVDAVISHYGGIGIEVVVGSDEQRELWLETQPGDQLRVADLGHTRTVDAFAGSWFWGGAQVGDDTGPIVGYLTGSTPGVMRNDVTAGSERGDATTSAFIGRSGRGKTTGMMLSLLDAGFREAFVLALDFKGDLGGLVNAAQAYGLDAQLVQTGTHYAGVADLFRMLEEDERAQIEVPAQLGIALPSHLRVRGAETPIQKAVNQVIADGQPATWKVVERLRNSDDPLAREAGEALYELSLTGVGAPFMGRPSGEAMLSPKPGLWVVQMPGLSLPDSDSDREDWNVTQRLSVALMHSMIAYAVTTAGRKDLRGMRKVVAVPEVHVLTATREGSAFLQYIARVGRALSTALVVDTQDPESLAGLTGLVEQLTTVFGFQLTTPQQQDALAALLGLPDGEHTRRLIQAIGVQADGEIRHGHCITRDRRFACATTQFDIPSIELLELLSTTPTIGRFAAEPDNPREGLAQEAMA